MNHEPEDPGVCRCSVINATVLPASPVCCRQSAGPISHTSSRTDLLVRLREGFTPSDKQAIKRDYGAVGLRALARMTPPQHAFGRWHRIEFKSRQQRDRSLGKIRRDRRIEYVEPDYRISADVVPNDPDFYRLWGLHYTGQTSLDRSQTGY